MLKNVLNVHNGKPRTYTVPWIAIFHGKYNQPTASPTQYFGVDDGSVRAVKAFRCIYAEHHPLWVLKVTLYYLLPQHTTLNYGSIIYIASLFDYTDSIYANMFCQGAIEKEVTPICFMPASDKKA